jgi:non-POU domain-containing octamer-binding protein
VQQLLSENVFLVSNSPRPVRVEFAVDAQMDDSEGAPVVPSKADGRPPDCPPPHFATPGSLEFDFALRWRELALAHAAEKDRLRELHRQEREVLRHEQSEIYQHEFEKFKLLDDPIATAMGRPSAGPSQRGVGQKRALGERG